jgi:hypothetical protein
MFPGALKGYRNFKQKQQFLSETLFIDAIINNVRYFRIIFSPFHVFFIRKKTLLLNEKNTVVPVVSNEIDCIQS